VLDDNKFKLPFIKKGGKMEKLQNVDALLVQQKKEWGEIQRIGFKGRQGNDK